MESSKTSRLPEEIADKHAPLAYRKTVRGNGDPRYESTATNAAGDPVVVIDLPPGGKVTKLGFVRSTPEYPLVDLMGEFHAWCAANTPDNIASFASSRHDSTKLIG